MRFLPFLLLVGCVPNKLTTTTVAAEHVVTKHLDQALDSVAPVASQAAATLAEAQNVEHMIEFLVGAVTALVIILTLRWIYVWRTR